MLALMAGGGDGFSKLTSASVSVSVATLLTGLVSVSPAGGDTVTVLLSVPVASGAVQPLSAMNTLWPLGRLSPLHSPVAEL